MGTHPIQEIETLIRARYPILYIVSSEERRVEQAIGTIAKTLGRQLHTWSISRGLFPPLVAKPQDSQLPGEITVLAQILDANEKRIIILRDFHFFMADRAVIRLLRDVANRLRGESITVIVLSPLLKLPPELEKDITVMNFPLPTAAELDAKLNDVIRAMQGREGVDLSLNAEEREALIKSAQGLTLDEAENCLARSLVLHRSFKIDVMLEEKKQIIQKSGMLEYYPPTAKLSDVGGHELLKEWLQQRGSAFTDKARGFGLPEPKGVLLLGVQGTGKSLVAKAISAAWNLPLLKLDVGRIFGSFVGQSEENIRKAIAVAESVAPCVLWADELEKGFGGMTGNSGDSGTSQRVFATFLSWMQEKTKPVFLVATANDVSKLPPELLRKGRFDDIFFIDLPDGPERQDILCIHLRKRKRNPADFDTRTVAEIAEGFSGAELEQVVVAALFAAFHAGRELQQGDLEHEARTQVPLSRMMKEDIAWLRDWAKMRTRPSSRHDEFPPREPAATPQVQPEESSTLPTS